MKTYQLSTGECFSLLGAIEARIRQMEGVIESEAEANPLMVEAAELDIRNLQRVWRWLTRPDNP